MTTHELKIWPEFFEEHLSGEKTFELRNDDRHFEVGDILRLREWVLEGHFYSGRELSRRVTHILRHRPGAECAADFGLSPGYAILSVSSVDS